MIDIYFCFLSMKKENENISSEELRKMEGIIRKLMSIPIVTGG